jgi:diguanylate cyclase (GGDEF)-like protein
MGHDAGNVAIRAYFQNVTAALTDRGDAYRLGGDEVGVIVPACPLNVGIDIIRRACLLLQQEHLQFEGEGLPPVSIAAGIIVSSTPADSAEQLRKLAEASMYKAKKFTKEHALGRSSWNVAGVDEVQVIESNAPSK